MSPQPLNPGARLGKYKVLEHIATGGMGIVYKASDEELGRTVALKVLDAQMADKPNTLERFRREARHAARLTHKNIVTLYEYGQADGMYFLALEYVDGIDLYDYIERKGRLAPEESRRILVQAVKAARARLRAGHHPSRHQAVELSADARPRSHARQIDRHGLGTERQ